MNAWNTRSNYTDARTKIALYLAGRFLSGEIRENHRPKSLAKRPFSCVALPASATLKPLFSIHVSS